MLPQQKPSLTPPRGFPPQEFEQRLMAAQIQMHAQQLDALLLTTEPEVRYFSGFHSQFWESPTRPWFLVVPLKGKPVAVIPEIGRSGMMATWLDDIRTWPAPRPEDDGISLLAETITALSRRYGRLGVPMGHETFLRLPLQDFQKLSTRLAAIEIIDCAPLIRQLRFIKSPAEIAKIHHICDLASAAFENLPQRMHSGQSEREICQDFRMDLLRRGADNSPYLISGSGPDGYDNIIMGPSDRIIEQGDVLIIDTGTTFDGYFCDFDRNFAFGKVSDPTRRAYDTVYRATEAGFAAARPGAVLRDIWAAMWAVLEAGGALSNDVGRMGHGLGMQLTEGPSVSERDDTLLHPGAVLTLEPGMTYAPGKQMVHEENIVITEEGARLLSRRAAAELPIIS
ncbi:M24 family metallopeptidase [Kiloniella laminariae]|uniref:M24 family metallopeptidase n=1 Tax=Kiloniella laminariae TaxID=454162 RepID=UPI000399829A|nr:Xaa-Pro peptidase family protein [Kiloniella laminariae]